MNQSFPMMDNVSMPLSNSSEGMINDDPIGKALGLEDDDVVMETKMTTDEKESISNLGNDNEGDTSMSTEPNYVPAVELPIVLKSIDTLRSAISEVIAFPTALNYSRLLNHARGSYEAYTKAGRAIELGELNRSTSSPLSHNSNESDSDNRCNDDKIIDQEFRSQLNAFGTSIWNLIQKHSELFIDTITEKTNEGGNLLDTEKENNKDVNVVEKNRGAASGFIRSLACRLILISKLQTRGLEIPQLVLSNSSPSTISASNTEESSPLPSALSSELEFGLKCLARAGRAIISHSDDYNSAYDTLSLAVVCWNGIKESRKKVVDREQSVASGVNRDHSSAEAFNALLLLPDCASKLTLRDNDTASDVRGRRGEVCDNRPSHKVIAELQRLEKFVDDQIVLPSQDCEKGRDQIGPSCSLFVLQHYLPSLARVGYKHGNRFARQQEYDASQEALRISLKSSDMCLAKLRHGRAYGDDLETSKSGASLHASQIQEQEMLVVSKQSFYILSHVCRSVGKLEEAGKFLDRIQVYIDEQRRHDDEIFNETMVELSARDKSSNHRIGFSAFALEGPQKQDMEEIKSRAQSARAKARMGEATERVNLAFSRIDLRQRLSTTLNEGDESFIDAQFQIMIECSKRYICGRESSVNDDCFDLRDTIHSTSEKEDSILKLVMATARMVFSRRLLKTNENDEESTDPYRILIEVFREADDTTGELRVILESLHTTIMAAKTVRDSIIGDAAKIQTELDKRALEMSKSINTQLRNLAKQMPLPSHSKQNESTLFTCQRSNRFECLFQKARDYFIKAVSLYQGTDKCAEQTQAWCDILIEALEICRQTRCNDGVSEEQNDKTMAGVMAIKSYAQSSCGSYGSGLKTARGAWEKDGTELGNLVTLFYCSLRYESFSNDNMDSKESGLENAAYSNTLLELDNAVDVYLSLSSLSKSKDPVQNLLEVFPLLCKLALDKRLLLLGLQKRMIEMSVNVAKSIFSAGVSYGSNSIFGMVRVYLATFEDQLTIILNVSNNEHQIEMFTSLQNVLHCVLDLILFVRDCNEQKGSKGDDAVFAQTSLATKTDPMVTQLSDSSCQSLFDSESVKQLIGSEQECLWIAEQIWNISNQMIAEQASNGTKRRIAPFIAEYLRNAHDFAFLSEEEAGARFTNGHLARESFTAEHFASSRIDFNSENLRAIDLCSEFSAQCLLSSVANVIDYISTENPSQMSTDKSQEINFALKCLIVAMAELRTLEIMKKGRAEIVLVWLFLNLLLEGRDDESCVTALVSGGLLEKLKNVVFPSNEGFSGQEDVSPLEQVYILANRAYAFRMQMTAKHLFLLCAEEMTSLQKTFIINEKNTIGSLQRRIINLASTVQELLSTFECIDQLMKSHSKSNDQDLLTYKSEEIDYFVVEAHNRACSLTFVGDSLNAEKLLAVALNLLPYSSKEVESYGSEIRRAYRNVIGRQGIGGGALSMSAGDLVSLFEG